MEIYGTTPFAPARRPDEPARSWVVRTACIANAHPQRMHEHLVRLGKVQRPRNDELIIFVPPERQWAGGAGRAPMTTYCPLCFERDVRTGRLPHFRHAWQDPLRTYCVADRTPLFLWPHRYEHGTQAFFPPWMLALHVRGLPLQRVGTDNREVISQLRYVRSIRLRMGALDDEAEAWRQQLELEGMLEQRSGISCVLGGAKPDALRRVVQEISVLFASQFGAQRCQASYQGSFLGPRQLFETRFCDGNDLPPQSLRGLSSFSDPAQRRTLLALSVRLLLSFGADASFDEKLSAEGAGRTALTEGLDKLPIAGLQWLRRRLPDLPQLVRLGVQGAFERNERALKALGR